MKLPVYMDHNSTTPVDRRVLERMLPYFSESYGNAASRSHSFGWKAEEAVQVAREQVSALIGATSREIVFTSGATESDNLALFGVCEAYVSKGNHLVTQQTEHKAILDVCKQLERRGVEVTYLPVDASGRVDPEAVRAAITDKTVLVSVMLANNEIGTVQPISEIGSACRERGVMLHCDAAQGMTSMQLDVESMHVDLASLSAHKMYGPKGIGALYVRRKSPRAKVMPLIHGGGHERGMRSGTLNVPAIVGFGEAARLAAEEHKAEYDRICGLRQNLLEGITSRLSGVTLNGHPEQRLASNLNLTFDGIEAEAVMMAMKDVAVSSGSACTSATLEPSYVLRAIGVDDERAHGSIRFGLGRGTTPAEVEFTTDAIVAAVDRLRALDPMQH